MKNEIRNNINIPADVYSATVKSINTIDSIQNQRQIQAGENILSIYVMRFPNSPFVGTLKRTLQLKKQQLSLKKIYIAGKISNMPYDVAVRNFWRAEKKLSPKGETINPIRICKENWSWFRCMIVCIYYLIRHCDRIYLLDNWTESTGARIEVIVAIITKKKILRKISFDENRNQLR